MHVSVILIERRMLCFPLAFFSCLAEVTNERKQAGAMGSQGHFSRTKDDHQQRGSADGCQEWKDRTGFSSVTQRLELPSSTSRPALILSTAAQQWKPDRFPPNLVRGAWKWITDFQNVFWLPAAQIPAGYLGNFNNMSLNKLEGEANEIR